VDRAQIILSHSGIVFVSIDNPYLLWESTFIFDVKYVKAKTYEQLLLLNIIPDPLISSHISQK